MMAEKCRLQNVSELNTKTVEIRIIPKTIGTTAITTKHNNRYELKNATTSGKKIFKRNYSNKNLTKLEPSSSSSSFRKSPFNKLLAAATKNKVTSNGHDDDDDNDENLCELSSLITENTINDDEYDDETALKDNDDEDELASSSSDSSEVITPEDENTNITTATATTTASSTATVTATDQQHELINREHENVVDGIYLETPIVDENICMSVVHEYENAKPKRISDDFFSSDDNDDGPSSLVVSSSCEISSIVTDIVQQNLQNDDNSSVENFLHRSSREFLEEEEDDDTNSSSSCSNLIMRSSRVNSHDESQIIMKASSSLHDNLIANSEKSSDTISHPPTTSSESTVTYYDNDVQSMDAIERRDFEHEQRLTGGVIIKTNSLVNSDDKSNLELLKSYKDVESNTRRRASSDSKSTIINNKEFSTTPTSSRSTSVRLTKSTAKMNLFSTLDRVNIKKNKINKNAITKKSSIENKNSNHREMLPCSSRDNAAANLEKLSEAASSSSHQCPRVDMFLSSNSNDSLSSNKSYNTSSNHSLPNFSHKSSNNNSSELFYVASEEANNKNNLNPIKEDNVIKKENELPNDENLEKFSDPMPSTSRSRSPKCQYSNFCCEDSAKAAALQKDTLDSIKMESFFFYVQQKQQQNKRNSNATVNSINSVASRLNQEINNINENEKPQNYQEVAIPSSSHLQIANEQIENDFDDETWADCEEGSDEEVCTCHSNDFGHGSNTPEEDLPSKDVDLSGYIQMVSISEDMFLQDNFSPDLPSVQRKRKLKDGRLLDGESSFNESINGRKRMAFDCASTPRSSHTQTVSSPSTPMERRTPRSLIPTKDNPPPELFDWLLQFQRWSHAERIHAVDRLIEHCEPTQVRHMMKVIEPQFQRDFISLLPRELALQVLSYLEPKDLLRAAQTCRSWRFLCDDNLLWKEKCRQAQIVSEPKTDRPKRGRAGNMPPISSPWKAAYIRQHIIETNWRSRPIRQPKVLKGHDDHVITCLQFSGNRIVSGSDDNTLKVWSAVTGKCLRTLVGHTGGVWSSQMSGNIIISGSTDRTLKVWNMETGQCIHTLLGHTSTVRCMHLHGKKVVSGSRDATLRVWDIEQGTCLHVLVGHLAAVRCVQYDGKLIVSGAYDYMVKVWHPERQECLHTLQGHTNRVYSLQFDGIHVVSGSLDTSIRVWDAETGNCKHTLMGHQSLTSGMELRQNILVSGNADSTVKVWDITTGQCLQTLSGPNKHQSAVTCLQFSSRFVITSSDDGTVKLWDVKTGEFIRNLVALDSGGSGGVVWRIRANDTKLICAVGSRNGTEETKLMVLDFDVEGACLKCS